HEAEGQPGETLHYVLLGQSVWTAPRRVNALFHSPPGRHPRSGAARAGDGVTIPVGMPEDVAIDTRALADRVRDLVGARRLAQVRALLADLTVHDIAEAFRHLD